MRKSRIKSLFPDARLRYDEAMALTLDSMRAWGPNHSVWVIAWSGGKDRNYGVKYVARPDVLAVAKTSG